MRLVLINLSFSSKIKLSIIMFGLVIALASFVLASESLVILISPEDNSFVNNSSIYFVCKAVSSQPLLNLSLYVNFSGTWQSVSVNSSPQNNTPATFPFFLLEGTYEWNCEACDSDNCSFQTQNNSLIVDLTKPTITLESPLNNTEYRSTNKVDLNFTARDNYAIESCYYVLDGREPYSLSNCENISLENLSDGNHTLILNVTDKAGNSNYSLISFGINFTEWAMNIVSPLNNTQYNTNWVWFNVSTNKNMSWCNFTLDDQIELSMNALNPKFWYYNYSGLSEGLHNVSFTCSDGTTIKDTEIVYFKVNLTEPFEIYLLSPHLANYTESNIWINVSSNKNLSTCLFELDNSGRWYNLTKYNQTYYYNLSHFDEGTHNVFVKCNSTENKSKEVFIEFNVDTKGPVFTFVYPTPDNNKTLSTNWVHINVTTNEPCDEVILTWANSTNTKNYTMIKFNSTLFYYNVTNLSDGSYNYSVSGNDTLGNTASSSLRRVNIETGELLDDFSVTDISFSSENFIENQQYTVSVTVTNLDNIDVINLTVELNVSLWNGSKILAQSNESESFNLSAYEVKVINFTWVAKPGTYLFEAMVDPDDNISESNESNNYLIVNRTVSSWAIFYGNCSFSFSLEGNTDVFRNWSLSTSQGNIYFADADSDFSISDLKALDGFNDLIEADQALNMTGFNDSISALFDKDENGIPDNRGTFVINGTQVSNVPYINSTDNDNFITALLWDSGDGGSEYNGTQDLVIFTVINASKQGKYGVYDYEVRIPSMLASYKGSTNKIKRIYEFN